MFDHDCSSKSKNTLNLAHHRADFVIWISKENNNKKYKLQLTVGRMYFVNPRDTIIFNNNSDTIIFIVVDDVDLKILCLNVWKLLYKFWTQKSVGGLTSELCMSVCEFNEYECKIIAVFSATVLLILNFLLVE